MAGSKALRDRLDRVLVARGLAPTRTKAQALILAGRVRSGESCLDKPGMRIGVEAPLDVRPGPRYVGRGGHKLAGALEDFDVFPRDRHAIDVGASTGGFTQVLLEAGASSVIALDVGRGQLDWSLRQDPRVRVVEGVNARYLEASALPLRPSLAVVDVSFISLERVLPPVVACLEDDADVLALVKPQFEVGRGEVGKGGIVDSVEQHRRVLTRLADFAVARGWGIAGFAASALRGAEGNREFFVHLTPRREGLAGAAVEASIRSALDAVEERTV